MIQRASRSTYQSQELLELHATYHFAILDPDSIHLFNTCLYDSIQSLKHVSKNEIDKQLVTFTTRTQETASKVPFGVVAKCAQRHKCTHQRQYQLWLTHFEAGYTQDGTAKRYVKFEQEISMKLILYHSG